MTREECGNFLNELLAYYPNLLKPGINEKTLYEMWFEALKDEEYKRAHEALIRYFKTDRKGYVPTVGQLLPNTKVYMTEEEEQEIMRNLVY